MEKKGTKIDVKKTGQNIKRLMEREQVSCAELAEKIGVTPNAISNYRNGYNLPDIERIMELSAALNADVSDIIVYKEGGKKIG